MLVLAPGHGFSHGLHQGAVVVGTGGAAQLELDAAGRQLLPPALEPRQHRRRLPQPQGDAGGDTGPRIQAPEPVQRLPQPLAPPVVQGQVQAAAGRRAQAGQQRFEGLQGLGRQALELGHEGRQLGGNGVGLVGAQARVKASGFAPSDQAVLLDFHQQVLHRGRGAPADGQGHGLGEGKTLQPNSHPLTPPAMDLPWQAGS